MLLAAITDDEVGKNTLLITPQITNSIKNATDNMTPNCTCPFTYYSLIRLPANLIVFHAHKRRGRGERGRSI
jgi:hypothetical protein